MKLFILSVALLSSLEATAVTVYGSGNRQQAVSTARQAQIQRAQNEQRYKSLALSSVSSSSAAQVVQQQQQSAGDKAFRVQTVHPSLAGYCKDVNGPGGATLVASIRVASLGYSCIQVRCDADLNFNQILDINEYVDLASPCNVNTLTGQPYTQADCPGIWVVDYEQSGSGFLEIGSCHSDNAANRANVFSRLECNIPGFMTTTLHTTDRLCIPANAQYYQQQNRLNIPDINNIINNEIHNNCLDAYQFWFNLFINRTCARGGGDVDQECARCFAQLQAGAADIDGDASTPAVSCANQIDDYLNRPRGATPNSCNEWLD